MQKKAIAVILLTLWAGALVSRPVRAVDDPRSGESIHPDIQHDFWDWQCLDSFLEPPVEKVPPRKAMQIAPSPGGSVTPWKQPDPALASIPYHYLEVIDQRVPLYSSLDAAVAKKKPSRHLLPGFTYVSFDNQILVNGKWYYRISPQLWMPGGEAAYLGTIPSFQGLVLEGTPEADFGWVLVEVESQSSPGGGTSSSAGKVYQRYDVVWVLEEESQGGMDYLRVGEGEWVPADYVGRVTVQESPPQGVEGDRWIDINLEQQTLAVYDDGELVFATLVSTGVEGNWTRPGTFQIDTKKVSELMRGSFAADRSDYYYLEDVPWTMYFDQMRALHGTYWHNSFGRPHSRGCVNLSPGDAHWIFDWVEEGDWVHVHDPSGETPVDPGLYHPGGA